MIFESLYVYEHFPNVVMITESIAAVVAQVITFFVLPSLWYYSDRIYKMIDELKDLSSKWQFNPWYKYIQSSNKIDQNVMKFLLANMLTTCTFYVLLPGTMDLILYLINGREPTCNMPFSAAFFYDIRKSPAYEISYFFMGWAVFTSTLAHLAANSLFFGCALNIGAHFDILRKMIHECEMEEFIEYHRKILNLAYELNEIYQIILIIEHLLLSVLTCTICFQTVMVELSAQSFLALGFAITAVMELFIYSYGGQIIMDKSSEICDEVYKLDKRYLFIIMRSHKKVEIKVGFFLACLPNFTNIVNSAGSLMALMKSFI